MTVVAAMITGAEEVLYPFYAEARAAAGIDALADQRLGGLIMWVPAGHPARRVHRGLLPLGRPKRDDAFERT